MEEMSPQLCCMATVVGICSAVWAQFQVGSTGLACMSGSWLAVGWTRMALVRELKQCGSVHVSSPIRLAWAAQGSGGGARGSSTFELFRPLFKTVTNIPLAIEQVYNQNGREVPSSSAQGMMNTGRTWEYHGGAREVQWRRHLC